MRALLLLLEGGAAGLVARVMLAHSERVVAPARHVKDAPAVYGRYHLDVWGEV